MFKVKTIAAGTVTPTAKDERNFVQRMFYKWVGSAAEGERMQPLDIVPVDCTNGSLSDLGFKGDNKLEHCIPVLLNYKGGVDKFNGATKGKNCIILGGQQGYNGPNLMIPLENLRELGEQCVAVADAIEAAAAEEEAEEAAGDVDLTDEG